MLGEVTESQLKIARHADQIFIEEIVSGGFYREIAQAFAALLPVKAVGVAGDRRIYSQMVWMISQSASHSKGSLECTDISSSSANHRFHDRFVSGPKNDASMLHSDLGLQRISGILRKTSSRQSA